ncbi:PEP-CTERM system TPR-repeat protein PrsT [Colwellia sp. M166]|uniref:XrtA/PEP-CTERM system TPR-repeat protein PrsT n=1 Tax=Colwellia sp. M166 TaxID=2583805 RepID=UPI00211DA57B|nr:XrtA/PEP-CTERM system TPR-repeat protein PrsT [Colwellia sp. M166]UUO22032.1 PEP-CTERM system TPR-repeat protein PrsT [Colwellia sp. M166]
MKNSCIALFLFVLFGCSEQGANDYLASAKTKLAQQDYDSAIIELKNAIKTEPSLAEARFLLGKLYLQTHQYENAEKEFERAMAFNYPASEVVPLLSQTYQKTGADDTLLKLSLKKSGLKADDLVQVRFYKLQAMVRLEQIEKAKGMINKIKVMKTQSPFKQLSLVYAILIGNGLFDKGLVDEKSRDKNLGAANIQLDGVLAKYPTQSDALTLKANLQIQAKDIQGAIDTYRLYVENYPEDKQKSFLFARLLTDSNQTAEAEPIIDSLLKINSENPLLNQLKAIARFNDKDNVNALLHAERTLLKSSTETPARLIAGISAYLLKDLEKANQHLSFVASELPASHQALRILADTQLRLGLLLEANDTVTKFDEISEQDASLLSGVGRALLRKGELNKAKAVLNKQPKALITPDALANVGLLKLSLNDLSGIIDLEKALGNLKENLDEGLEEGKQNLSPEQLQQALAQAYFSTEQFSKVMMIAKKWQQTEDLKLQGFIMEAKVLTKQNKPDKAKALYQKVLIQEPNNPAVALAIINLSPTNTKVETQTVFDEVAILLKTHPAHLPIILKHYLLSKVLGHDEIATTHLEQLLQQTPTNQGYKITLGKLLLIEGKTTQAISQFESAKSDTSAPFWSQLAFAYINTKQYNKATALYQAWVEQQPNNPEAITGMIKVHMTKGEQDKALALTEYHLNELGGKHIEIQLLRLQLLLSKGAFEQVENELDALPENIQALPYSQGVRGQVQLKKREFPQAMKNLKTAYHATSSPTNTNLMVNVIYQTQGEQASLSFLNKHITQHPNDEKSTLKYALLQTSKNNDEALTYYLKTIELNANNIIALNNVASLYMKKQNFQQALQFAQQAFSIKPNEIQILDTLGSIELKLSKNESALQHLTRAINLSNNDIIDSVFVN